MNAKMACFTILLFSCSSSKSHASSPKTKYREINNFYTFSNGGILLGSNMILETGENLSTKESMEFSKLYHGETLKLALVQNRTEKKIDKIQEKVKNKNKRSGREERDFSEINSSDLNNYNNTTPAAENERTPVYSEEFLSCGKIKMKPEEYAKFENGTVYVSHFDMLFNEEKYIIEDQHLLICSNFLRKKRLESPGALQIASLVCTCLSTVFISLFIVMFMVDKDLRTLPGSCVLSLCVSQLVAYTCTFVQYHIRDEKGCRVIGMLMFYFFLASFFWMNVMSFDIWRSVRRSIVELRLCTGRSIGRQLSIYSLYAWGTPLVIAVASISVHFTTTDDKFRLLFRLNNCWFRRLEALWLYFAGPVLILLGANFLSFAVVFYMLQKVSKSPFHSSFKGRTDLRSRLVLCLKLNSVMGLTWLFGVVAELTAQEWLKYPYVFLNALQGLFIFFSYAVNAKTKRIAGGFLKRHRLSSPSSSDQTKTTRL